MTYTISLLICSPFAFVSRTIRMMTYSWSTCSLLTHIAYGDGIWNCWVSSQCKHFQICDKCYEAEQMHEDRESHICLIFKTISTADSLHANNLLLSGSSDFFSY